MAKNIQIIGGGLYGCLTAYHIAKQYPNYKVDLIERGNHLLPAFNPISLAGFKFNNGLCYRLFCLRRTVKNPGRKRLAVRWANSPTMMGRRPH